MIRYLNIKDLKLIMSGVFKLYDIRGVYGQELTDELLYKIGYALGRYFNNYESIGIVRDIRLSSPRIRDILVETLVYTHDVLDFGIGSTPEAPVSYTHLTLPTNREV